MRVKAVTARQPAPTAITRLRAALKPDITLRRVKRQRRILLRLLPVILLPFAGAVLLAMHPPYVPHPGAQPVQWLDLLFFCVAALTIIGAFIVAANRVLRDWGDSAPESPEAAIREFYREALSGRPSARRLGALLRGFEVAGPRVQPVFHWLSAAAVPALDSPRAVAKYWRVLVRGNPELVRRLRVTSLEIESPAPDIAVATVRMRATVERRLQAAVAMAAGAGFAIAPFFVGAARIEFAGVSFWTAVAAASALGFSLGWLLRITLRAVIERREVAVHKLLVRAGHTWRLVSGEWESQDEADLAWLDPAMLK